MTDDGRPPLAASGLRLVDRLTAVSLGLIIGGALVFRATLLLCDRAYLMRVGTVEVEGTPEELRRDQRVQTAYLGVPE